MRSWSWLLALVIALSVGARAVAQSPPRDASAPADGGDLAAIVRSLADARVGVVVMEASSGRVRFEHEADLSLNPASNAKLLTAAAALSLLGPERRFTTALYGNVQGAAVAGPLVLEGLGDPSLTTADLVELARRLREAGVRRVEGDVVVDDTLFGAQHLPPAFEQQPRETAPFRAAVGAAAVDEGAMTVRVRPGDVAGQPARVSVDPPGYVVVEGVVNTVDGGAALVALDTQPMPGGRERLRVSGRFPLGAPTAVYRRRLENPGLAAGWALRSALEIVGVRVQGTVRAASANLSGLARIARHESAPLSALLYEVGKDSNNFYAEMCLLAIAAEPGDAPAPTTFARGAERVSRWAAGHGVNVERLVVLNGSGLYDANRASARQLAQVLRAAWRDPASREEYLAMLAVAGRDGTLRGRLREVAPGRVVRAKTGTLDDVVALSGYVLGGDSADALIVSVVANGVRGRTAEARAWADRIVAAVASGAQAATSAN